MNRTWIRGVTAGIGAGLTLVTVAVIGPTIARGAENDRAVVIDEQHAETQLAGNWTLPDVGRYLHLRPRHRPTHHATHASRAMRRNALTASPQTVAHALVLRAGWSEQQWTCLDALWMRESRWETYATNGGSGAYGIPQALPGYKMASFGADWRTNPITQIRWGLWYIATVYGSPCNALAHSNATGFY